MGLVLEKQVRPYHGQIDLSDSAAFEYPQWETGEERILTSDQAVVVATRGDDEGDVLVQIFDDEGSAGNEGLTLLLNGQVNVASGILEIGNLPGNIRLPIAVPGRGYVDVATYVDPSDPPSRVVFVIPGAFVQSTPIE